MSEPQAASSIEVIPHPATPEEEAAVELIFRGEGEDVIRVALDPQSALELVGRLAYAAGSLIA